MTIDSSADNEILSGVFPCKGYRNLNLIEARVIAQYHKNYDPKLIEIMPNEAPPQTNESWEALN